MGGDEGTVSSEYTMSHQGKELLVLLKIDNPDGVRGFGIPYFHGDFLDFFSIFVLVFLKSNTAHIHFFHNTSCSSFIRVRTLLSLIFFFVPCRRSTISSILQHTSVRTFLLH